MEKRRRGGIGGKRTGSWTNLLLALVAAAGCSSSSGGGSHPTFTFPFCADNAPIWVGSRDGTSGSWGQLHPNGNSYSFTIPSGKGSVAAVYADGSGFDLFIINGSTDDFNVYSSYATNVSGCTSNTVNGSVANVPASDVAAVSLGFQTSLVFPNASNNFTLQNVSPTWKDVLGARMDADSRTIDKFILRTNQTIANNATLDVLDFGAAEAFDPATGNLTVSGLTGTGEQAEFITGYFYGTNAVETSTGLVRQDVGDGQTSITELPTAKVSSGQFQDVYGYTATRDAGTYILSNGDKNLAFGPAMSTPTVTQVSTSPYLILNLSLPSQAEYNAEVDVEYDQESNSTTVWTTAGFLGGAPQTWNISIPDLSGAPGFNTSWGLENVATDYHLDAFGGKQPFLLASTPADGDSYQVAHANGDANPARIVGRPPVAASHRPWLGRLRSHSMRVVATR